MKIIFVGQILLGLFLAVSLTTVAISGFTPPNEDITPNNPIPSFGHNDFFVMNDYQYYIDYNKTISILDVRSTENINKIGVFEEGKFSDMVNTGNVIYAIEEESDYNNSHYQADLHLLLINTEHQISSCEVTTLFIERPNQEIQYYQSEDYLAYIFREDSYLDEECLLVINCTSGLGEELVTRYTSEILDIEFDHLWDYHFDENIMCIANSFGSTEKFTFYDITDILNPIKLGEIIPTHTALGTFQLHNTKVYHPFNDNNEAFGLDIYDFSDPENPTSVESIETDSRIRNLALKGDLIYMCLVERIDIYYQLEYHNTFNLDIQEKYHDSICDCYCTTYNRIYYNRVSSTPTRVFSVIEIEEIFDLTETVYGYLFSSGNSSLPYLSFLSGFIAVFIISYFYSKKKVEKN